MNWNWLVGREFSLGVVESIEKDQAVLENGDVKVPISELLEADYAADDDASKDE